MIYFDVGTISVQELLANRGKRNRIEDKGIPEWFLGIKYHVVEKRLIFFQARYVKNLIEKWKRQKCKPVYGPVVTSKTHLEIEV